MSYYNDDMRQVPKKAAMSITRDEHTVVVLATGQRFPLPPKAAWELYDTLNKESAS